MCCRPRDTRNCSTWATARVPPFSSSWRASSWSTRTRFKQCSPWLRSLIAAECRALSCSSWQDWPVPSMYVVPKSRHNDIACDHVFISPFFFSFFFFSDQSLQVFFRLIGKYEFEPTTEGMQKFQELVCANEAITQPLCTNMLFLIAGYNRDQFNTVLTLRNVIP